MSLFHLRVSEGPVVDLKEEKHTPVSPWHPYDGYDFGIYLHHTHKRIGYVDLRIGMNEELYYAGNVGYRINEPWRGHSYAYEACKILFRLAKNRFHMTELIITCSPENLPSRTTLERLGGTLKETADVPSWHWLYERGETVKNIYTYKL